MIDFQWIMMVMLFTTIEDDGMNNVENNEQ